MKIAHLKIMLVGAGVLGPAFLKRWSTCCISFGPITVVAHREASTQNLRQFFEID